jgi:hypothetical protein
MALTWKVDGIIITPEMSDALDDQVALSEGSLNGASGMQVFAAMLKASPYYDSELAKNTDRQRTSQG